MLSFNSTCALVVILASALSSQAALLGSSATSTTNGDLCRTQCQSVYNFYRKFIEEAIMSQYLVKCLANCPETATNTTTATPTTSTSTTTTTPTTSTSPSTSPTPTTRTSTSTTVTPTTSTSTTTTTPSTSMSTSTTTMPTTRTSTSITITPTTRTSSSTSTTPTSRASTLTTTTLTTRTSTSTPTTPTTRTSTLKLTTPTTSTSTVTSRTSTTTTTTTTTSNNQECGVSLVNRNRVMNGINATECQFPWMGHVTGQNRGQQIYCGASILDSRHLITAAHCVRNVKTGEIATPSMVNVSVGSSDRTKLRTFQVSAVIMHPGYNPVTKDYDTAILRLDNELSFSDCVKPICLPSVTDDPSSTDFCEVAGWGLLEYATTYVPTILQHVKLPLVDQQRCLNSYFLGPETINDLKLCAGDYYNGGIDTCNGDSGGPLMCLSKGRYFLYGVTSFGRQGCGSPYYPGVYVRVNNPKIRDFIIQARSS